MNATITREDLARGRRVFLMHLNYGGAGSGYVYGNSLFPRLTLHLRYYKGAAARKAGRSSEWSLAVDGRPMASVEDVLAVLNGEARPDDTEQQQDGVAA